MNKFLGWKQNIIRFLKKVRRYPSELRVTGNEYVEYEIDDMILTGPMHTFYYFRFEYIISFLFSLLTAGVVSMFLFLESSNDQVSQVTLLKYWLRIGVLLNLFALLPKGIILRRIFKIPLHNERLVVRRLMLLVRSNVFYWNEKVSFVLYNYYIFGMGKLASSNACGGLNSEIYRLCHFVICSFLLRLVNLFIRFFVEYYILTSSISYDSLIDRGATSEEISAIPIERLSEDDLKALKGSQGNEWCGICLSNFAANEEIKRLPCSEKHIFHKHCADTWLSKQSVCPYCRRPLFLSSNDK